jgi:hypothetical protein
MGSADGRLLKPAPGRSQKGRERMSEGAEPPKPGDALMKRAERRTVELRAYLVRARDEIVDVRILNLSYDGCGIETIVPLKAGEQLKLSVLGRGAVRASVRWYRDRTAGLQFEPEPPAAQQTPREGDRPPVAAEIVLRRSGKPNYRVTLTDATRFGCKCDFVERPTIGEHVWVKFEHLESLEARVCWIDEASTGLEYVRPLHPAVFDMLLHRLTETTR